MRFRGKVILFLVFSLALTGLLFFQTGSQAAEEKPLLKAPNCLSCHTQYKDQKLIMGDFQSYSRQAKLLTVKIGPRSQTVKLTEKVKLQNAPSYRDISPEAALKIYYEEKPDGLYATEVVVKPQLKVPDHQLISLEELAKLVQAGPEKGKFTLLDSRPGYRFQEDHIPGALSMPLPNFDKLTHLLPKDKSQMVIFYCGGFT